MRGTLVNLNVNPCKMCMPMGAVTALYGIKKCISILHGSQGCSTYIRRHMATHYNEPVDIASSSLTEEGTVYGGEKNLRQGLINLIKVYEPEVIGVATTCLAETIGEDISRMIDNFYQNYPEYRQVTIIPVSSAGYEGTQYEGFLQALYQVVKTVTMEPLKNEKVNIITSQLSPADTRYLKELLEDFEIDYILLPDLSDNLDGVYQPEYQKLPRGGTKISDIRKMAGAKITIELSSFAEDKKSAAKYLYDTFDVPYIRCNLPTSLRDNDELIKVMKKVSGKEVPERRKKERGRFLDAMIDAHKYNGEARAAIYGEPDFVYSTVRLCVENGIMPMIAATGARCSKWKELLQQEIKALAESYYIERYEILDEVDFQTIEERARELKINLMIGNSDGRRIAEKLGITLVRRSFPIHDRMGGQRLRMLGYEGALTVLDDISNTVLGKKEAEFREHLYEKYFDKEEKENLDMDRKTETHPCYNCGAHKYARMHLPIAPKCNISCNYCVRKYDCPNESRPGVTTSILKPKQALEKFLEVKAKVPNLTVVGIAGPGDALANFEETKETLALIRKEDPNITFCVSTNGLMLPQYAAELLTLGVSHVTVTMNAVDPKIGARIYNYVDYMGVKYYDEAAAAILMSNQLAGIKMLTLAGVVCKINIVMIKGINDQHIPEVVKKVKELGAKITNIMPLIPVKGSAFEHLPQTKEEEILEIRNKCSEIMKQMYHCRQCRADAIGTLGEDRSKEFGKGYRQKIQIAVASKSGMLVDQHFGMVSEFYVYEFKNGDAVFKEKRTVQKYCGGSEECGDQEDKMDRIIQTISDCNAVIAMRIGEAPKQKLNLKGIRVFTTYDRIEDSVKKAAADLL